jgi:DNA-binding MarR family transcriptional regulator
MSLIDREEGGSASRAADLTRAGDGITTRPWSAMPTRQELRQLRARAELVTSLAAASGLTKRQLLALVSLPEQGSDMGAFARSLGVTSRAATAMADRLVRAGMVETNRDDQDRRVVRLALTHWGRKTREEYRQLQDPSTDGLPGFSGALR